MNLLQEIICAVWGCNDKVRFTSVHGNMFITKVFCSRCHQQKGNDSITFMGCNTKILEVETFIATASNAEMHKKYGYDFKY